MCNPTGQRKESTMSKSIETKAPAFIAYHVPDRDNAY